MNDKEQWEENLKSIKIALQGRDLKKVRLICRQMETADISEAMEELDLARAILFFRLIPRHRRAEVFSFLEFERQKEMLDVLPDVMIVTLLNQMEPVDRTRLLEELPEEISSKFIEKLSPEERKMAWQLLSYPEDTVGRIMSPEFVALNSGTTVSEAIAYIRWNAGRFPEFILHNLFVIDESRMYLGHMSLATLIAADPAYIPVNELMDTTITALLDTAHESEAVDSFRKYDRPFIPIVDAKGILVGVVEAEEVFDIAEEDATEDFLSFGGQGALEDSYFQTSVFELLKKRAGWLAILFLGSMFTANALSHFEDTIRTMSYLIFFLPLVIASGGNSGSQAASLMIRGFAVKEVELEDWGRVLLREMVIGGLLGLILGILGYGRILLGGQPHYVGIIVAGSIIGIVSLGAVIGAMLPFLIKSIKLDPAVSSSPVIASLVDLAGILIFFNVAALVMKYLVAG